ncbi:hypothetical protein EV140_0871 [Microcella alkaliphila]|uniref:DUF2087 domain-containing protein n=2 Tax=Microcella alkaliphila TaxID=279828 RepID=A0A4V6MBV1_9MICO|nr:hypothetical protein EV140_0871 [Microcella alkaliphila]
MIVMPPIDPTANPSAWRPLLAALARPHSREAAARLMLGATLDEAVAPVPATKRERVVETLHAAGLVDPSTGRFDESLAPRILAANRVAAREGVDRFLVDGRIAQYPANPDARRELLTEVARRAIRPDEVLDEPAINERLAAFSDDVAVLRRYLVNHELLERRADGSEYARVVGGGPRRRVRPRRERECGCEASARV